MIIQLNEYKECTSETCLFRFECAQHRTAGDYRSEDGFSPEIHRSNGKVYCGTADKEPYEEIIGFDYGFDSRPENLDNLGYGFVSDIPDLDYDPIHLGM